MAADLLFHADCGVQVRPERWAADGRCLSAGQQPAVWHASCGGAARHLDKSVLLAVGAACAARLSGKVSFWAIAAAIAACQLVGTLVEWAIVADFFRALQDLQVGYPGLLVQLFGGYALLKALAKL